jgi:serine/threonine protein kinase
MYTKDESENTIPNIGSHLVDFEVLSELGRGAYGIVSKVRSLIDKNLYVIKMMDLRYMKEKQQKECWKEAMILKKINHPNIIK